MFFKKVNEKLNKNLHEETALINSLPFWKYFLIYIPILFLMFATGQFIAYLLFEYQFDFKSILFQAICFAVFFRFFHYVRKLWNKSWKNR
ncbi:hypothetical protein [uncultured Polaribacter sp.]|uniref:hypothetical protein n=1 Tax=uncultured Polaribacter sp. TaxID=174711 RepID=UPI0030DCA96B|tara:strand:- start:1098 stop:1367 length:270 start_codon:yes stop_codon:yes gene_type:complete